VLSIGFAERAHAQWTAISLHPPGATDSTVTGIADGWQWGTVTIGGHHHACGWNGTAASFVDLHPPGATDSWITAASPGQQVGYFRANGPNRACMWNGTAASWTRLDLTNPADSTVYSSGYASAPGLQAGSRTPEFPSVATGSHAALWHGSTSWIDLNPASASQSEVYGAGGSHQFGYAIVGSITHASLWNGSAASWIDLHPSSAAQSYAYAGSDTEQVGAVEAGAFGTSSLACKWNGSATSSVILHPGGIFSESQAYATMGGWQVGYAATSNDRHACIWHGTAGSFKDLSTVLGTSWSHTDAVRIWIDSTNIYVGGDGYNLSTGRDEALLWVRPLCCRADFNCSGTLGTQDIFDFLSAWFEDDPRADFDGNGQFTEQDVFAFLNAWFAGCG
jgi:hypothetical protein